MTRRRPTAPRERHATVLVVLAVVAACSNGDDDVVADQSVLGDDLTTIGSFDFSESQTLALVYGGALEPSLRWC